MIGTTNESQFDSWTTTLKRPDRPRTLSLSYVLGNSRAWGGQPTASYSGNGIAVTPEQQFAEGEWGPTRHDDRHRIVFSGNFDLGAGFSVSPILQWASARPYTPVVGFDINGDGQTNILDRVCEGTSLAAVFAARGNRGGSHAQPERLPDGPGEQSAIGIRGEPGRQHRGAQRQLLQHRPARHEELRRRRPHAARLRRFLQRVQHREPVVHVEARAEPGVIRVRFCSRCRSTGLASDLPSAGRSRRRSEGGSSSSLEATEGCGGNGSTRRNGETEFLNQRDSPLLRFSVM